MELKKQIKRFKRYISTITNEIGVIQDMRLATCYDKVPDMICKRTLLELRLQKLRKIASIPIKYTRKN